MLTAVFQGHEIFVVFATALTLLTGGLVHRKARARADRPLTMALWASSAAAILSLTLWPSGGEAAPQCVINKDVLEPFGTVQGQLNAAMFAPFGLLGILATRRLALTATLCVLFPALIETVQGLTPFISRLCDTSDLVANAAGAVCGLAVGLLANKAFSTPTARVVDASSYPLIACGALAVILTGSWLAWMKPIVMDRTVSQRAANSSQKAAVSDALDEAFGGYFKPDNFDFTQGDGESGTIMANFRAGAAELSWPDAEQFTVNLTPDNIEKGHTFPVPGTSGPVRSSNDAERIAIAYAERFAPWGLKNSDISVERIDEQEDLGWLVSWRRWKGEVLLPMRLDVVIEPGGHVRDLIARNIDDPELPKANVAEKEAWSLFKDHFGSTTDTAERNEPVLLAARRDGTWRVHWLLTMKTKDVMLSGTVDATDGTFHNPEERVILADKK
ncbi:VanZ family protein [Streptomyces sp. NRRL F-5135]|uniref:VanZ family protein n=1 Tax=Streptomyces sp. NRRL F-5135 TaxID=1463858 RepID=UPI000691BECC|nr:VanZ family protein [Streptomyces sp. NRRL F-5135]